MRKTEKYLTRSVMHHELDVKGLLCPLPVLKTRKKIRSMAEGDILTVYATDPASMIDMPHYCRESGQQLVFQRHSGAIYIFEIRKQAKT